MVDTADHDFTKELALDQCTFHLRDQSVEIRVGAQRFLLSAS